MRQKCHVTRMYPLKVVAVMRRVKDVKEEVQELGAQWMSLLVQHGEVIWSGVLMPRSAT